MSGNSLTSLMNAMINRLEFTQTDEISAIPEDRYWHMIQIYIAVDPLLASLYKQYCDTKDNLGRLVISHGSEDPMTEIAWDMHDSARSAVETRLNELKADKEVTDRAVRLNQARQAPAMIREKKSTDAFNDMMTFWLLASMAMNNRQYQQDIRRDFVRAC